MSGKITAAKNSVMEAGLPLWKRVRLQNKDMQFGTWNVRTLLQAGNMNIRAEEAERYKMDLVALQEIRLRGRGSIRKSKFTLHYSRDDVKQGYQGAGFIVSKKVSRSVLGLSPICDRICTLRFKSKFHNITFVNVYAPTGDAEDETADEFYETLQAVCDEIPKHDGLRLVQYATINNFKVLSIWFPRKDIHK